MADEAPKTPAKAPAKARSSVPPVEGPGEQPGEQVDAGAPAIEAAPPAAAAPLEAPEAPKSSARGVTVLPTLGTWAVDAAAERKSVVLDEATGLPPVIDELFEQVGNEVRCLKRLVQTRFFGPHAKPSTVLAMHAGRVLNRVEADRLVALLEQQAAEADVNADA